MSAPDLDELECLRPDDDVPDDARVTVTAGDLRALTDLIGPAREIRDTFGTLDQPKWEGPAFVDD
jgi:hypothetical protein